MPTKLLELVSLTYIVCGIVLVRILQHVAVDPSLHHVAVVLVLRLIAGDYVEEFVIHSEFGFEPVLHLLIRNLFGMLMWGQTAWEHALLSQLSCHYLTLMNVLAQ
jgi:hypothetical protein